MYPLKKGKTASQAHVGLPQGTFEEEHGRDAFTGLERDLALRAHPAHQNPHASLRHVFTSWAP